MLLKKIIIENVGPISYLNVNFPKDNERPKPLVIVGENGTGKSILISHLVNALVVGKQLVYEDVEVERGKVFKYRSPAYIKSGELLSYSVVEFETGEYVKEWQLPLTKKEFEERHGYTSIDRDWNSIPESEYSLFKSTFSAESESTKSIFQKQCCLYFPVNRFEEPAWLNLRNLQSKASYSDLKGISGYSNRELICASPLKNNIDWLLDILLDREIYEKNVRNLLFPSSDPALPGTSLPVHLGYSGQSNNIFEAVNAIIRIILRQGGMYGLE